MTAAVTVSTTDVLAWLRRRRGLRRRKLGRFAYVGYVIGILVLFYGIPIASTLQLNLGKAQVRADVGPDVARSLLAALAGLFLVALTVFVRSARWRGPVVLAVAEVTWLLPMPLERRQVLRPRFFVALGMAAVVGAVLGGISGAGVHAVRPATGGAAIGSFVAVFVLIGLLGVSLALMVEASPRLERLVQRWSTLPLVIGIAFVGVAVVTSANGSMPTWVDNLIAWSGPWGWGAYAISAIDRGGSFDVVVIAALGSVVVVTAGMAVLATRMCEAVPSHSLRVRARTAQSVGAAVFMGDARGARLSIRASRAQAGRARGGLRRPRSARLVIVWRDLIAVIRAPGQLGWAATFAFGSIGVLTVGVASSTTGKPPILVVILAVILGYAAATSLVETARLDSDNPQIAGQLPTRYALLALAHEIVPVAILASFGAVAWLVACALEPSLGLSGVAGVVLCAPVLIAAALFNSYRGRVPIELLINIGDAGGFVLAGWYLAAPAVVLAVLTPGIVHSFDVATTARGFGSVLGNLVIGSAAATSLGLWAVSLRAARRVAPPKEGGFFDAARAKT